jgi:ribonuclease BN (tRNA processing enzyme)
MTTRKITLDELRYQQFPVDDVLETFEERFERGHKLRAAMALTNEYHEEIPLMVRLANGDTVEISSSMIDYEDDYVEVKGGFGIPLKAIVDVGL